MELPTDITGTIISEWNAYELGFTNKALYKKASESLNKVLSTCTFTEIVLTEDNCLISWTFGRYISNRKSEVLAQDADGLGWKYMHPCIHSPAIQMLGVSTLMLLCKYRNYVFNESNIEYVSKYNTNIPSKRSVLRFLYPYGEDRISLIGVADSMLSNICARLIVLREQDKVEQILSLVVDMSRCIFIIYELVDVPSRVWFIENFPTYINKYCFHVNTIEEFDALDKIGHEFYYSHISHTHSFHDTSILVKLLRWKDKYGNLLEIDNHIHPNGRMLQILAEERPDLDLDNYFDHGYSDMDEDDIDVED